MGQTATIKVQEVIKSPNAVTPDAGDVLYDKIVVNLQNNVETYIDFMNISYLTSAFLNSAIGQLYSKYSSEQLNSLLHVLNLSENDLKIFKKVTDRARNYFGNEDAIKNHFRGLIDE